MTRGFRLSSDVTPSCQWGEARLWPGRRSVSAGESVHQLQRRGRVREGGADVKNVYSLPVAAPGLIITWLNKEGSTQQTRRTKQRSPHQTPLSGPGSGFIPSNGQCQCSHLAVWFRPAAIPSTANNRLIYSWCCCPASWTMTAPRRSCTGLLLLLCFACVSIQFLHISDARKRQKTDLSDAKQKHHDSVFLSFRGKEMPLLAFLAATRAIITTPRSFVANVPHS